MNKAKKGIFNTLTVLCAVFLQLSASAQVPTDQDCDGAIAVCQNVYSQTNSYAGEGNYPNEINANSSCLGSGELNSVWYTFTAQTGGQLCFTITPNVSNEDYDWAVYDLTNNQCSDIYNTPALEVSCNFSGNPGPTGANGNGGAQNNPCINVNAGETYVLNVSNFTSSTNGYTVDFGASTAAVFDQIPPSIQSVQTPIPCGATTLTFNFSENILCNTLSLADLVLNGPGGPYTLSNITGAACVAGGTQENTFTLTVSPPITTSGNFSLDLVSGAGFVEDLCGNVAPAGQLPFNIVGVIATATSTDEICLGDNDGTITVSGSNGTAPFVYDIGGAPQASGNFINLAPGTYTVTVTDANGCSGDTTITIAPGPFCGCPSTSTETVIDATCFGSATGTITINTVGPTGPFDYEWQDAVGTTIQTATDPSTDQMTGLLAGTYFIYITDNAACVDSLTVIVNEPTIVLGNPSNDTIICDNGTATLSANPTGGNGGPYTITWDNGLIGNGPHNVSPALNTCYSFTATDQLGCISAIESICVSLATPLQVTAFSDTTICPGEPALFNAIGEGGNGGPYSFSWSDGAGWQTTGQNGTVVPTATTTNYCVTVSDNCGTPPATDCITVELLPVPIPLFSADTTEGCSPLLVNFTNETDPSMVSSVLWDFGNGVTSTDNPLTSHNFIEADCYDITLSVTSQNGCVASSTMNDLICSWPIPSADFSWSPNPATTLFSTVTFYNSSTGNDFNFWTFGDLGTSDKLHPSFKFPDNEPGSYPVQLVVTNEFGCINSRTYTVEVVQDLLIYVPNAFTPNGDGINDFFFASGAGYDPNAFELLIFDRWGNNIYKSENIDMFWDGTYNGTMVPNGVYVWKIRASDPYSKIPRDLSGHVSVIR